MDIAFPEVVDADTLKVEEATEEEWAAAKAVLEQVRGRAKEYDYIHPDHMLKLVKSLRPWHYEENYGAS